MTVSHGAKQVHETSSKHVQTKIIFLVLKVLLWSSSEWSGKNRTVKDDGAYSSDSNNSNMYLMIIFIIIDYVVGKSLKK